MLSLSLPVFWHVLMSGLDWNLENVTKQKMWKKAGTPAKLEICDDMTVK